jgi:hypothetical protein
MRRIAAMHESVIGPFAAKFARRLHVSCERETGPHLAGAQASRLTRRDILHRHMTSTAN